MYNPFLYAWLNENFRREFHQVIPCIFSTPVWSQSSLKYNARSINNKTVEQRALRNGELENLKSPPVVEVEEQQKMETYSRLPSSSNSNYLSSFNELKCQDINKIEEIKSF